MPHPSGSSTRPAGRRDRLLILVTAGVVLLGVAHPRALGAQGIIGILPGAELGGEYRGNWQQYPGSSTRRGTDLVEWLQIPFGGRLFDAGLVQYRLSVRPEFRQSMFSGASDPLVGRQLGYGFSADLFSRLPVTLRLNAGHTGGSSSGGIGSENRFDYTTSGATLSFRNRYFPLQASLSRGSSNTTLRASPQTDPLLTSYANRRLSVSGGSSKLQLRYDAMSFDDRIGAADYNSQDGGLLHQVRWGKGSRLESRFELSSQSGALDFQRREWTERLHLQHTRSIGTDFNFRRATVGASGNLSALRDWGYQLSAQLGRGISAGLGAVRSVTTSGESRGNVSSVTPQLGIALPGPGGLILTASGSAGLEVRKQAGEGLLRVQVSDEPHSVPATRTFFLDQADVDTGSVVVRSAGTQVVYAPGADYLVVPSGRDVRLDVPLTSRIQIGDRVLVSYGWFTPASGDGRAIIASYRVGLILGGIRLEHDRNIRRGSGDAVVATGLPDYDDQATRLSARTGTADVRVDVEAGFTRRIRGTTARSEVTTGADATWPVTRRLSSSAGLHWSRSRADTERVDALSGRVSGTWTPRVGLQLIAGAEMLLWRPANVQDDRFLGLTLDALWHLFSVEVMSRYEYAHRAGPLTFMGHRFSTRLVRRF